MHGIKRTVIILLMTAGMLLLSAVPCSAAEYDPMQEMQDTLYALDIPPDAEHALRDTGIEPANPDGIAGLSPDVFLQRLTRTAKDEAAAPLRLCGELLALTVLTALLSGLSDSAAKDSLRTGCDMICTLLCVCTAVRPICGCLLRTAESLKQIQVFMAGFVPVFAAFLAAGGSVAGSSTYQVFVLFLTETVMQLTNSILFPLLQMGTAAGIADALNPKLRLEQIVTGFRSAVTWGLGSVMALFSALLSVRSFVASAADSLAAKSVRLLTSGMIPIVASAVSESYGTVQGSIRLLRNGTGAIGILVLLWMILPPLLSLLIYRGIFRLMQIFADLAGTEALTKLFRNLQAILSAAFAMLICSAVMLIFSSAIMILLTNPE